MLRRVSAFLAICGLLAVFGSPVSAAVKDLNLTGKTTGKDFVAGNLRYKNTDVTAVEYKPKGKTKPVTVLVFDAFNFSDHLNGKTEKDLFQDFEFKGAAFFAIPKGSGGSNVKAADLPAPLVKALGGANSKVFPLDLRDGVYFASSVEIKDKSPFDTLFKSMGVKKTSRVIKGPLTTDFLDITGIVLPNINIDWKALLAYLKIDFSLPDLTPDFYLPFKFANSKFDIRRERDVLGQTTGAIVASLMSDIEMNLGDLGKKTYPAVRISGRLDTGIHFGSLDWIDWPKLFDLPWVSLTEVKLDADVIRKQPLGDPTLKISMTAKGRVNDVKNIPVEASVEIEGKRLGNPYFSFPKFSMDLERIPGLKDIPGIKGVKLEDPVISPKAIGGKLTVEALSIDRASVLFFQTNRPKGWNFTALRDNLSPATIVKELKGTVIDKARITKAAVIVSKPGFKGKVKDLPKKVRQFLKGPLPDDDMALPLASGINVAGVFRPDDAGEVGKVLKTFGTPDEVILLGGIEGVFDKKEKPSLRVSGGFSKLTMPDLGFLKLPQPKNAPAVFMEYLEGQPALGVKVEETLPIKDGNRAIEFVTDLAFTVSPAGAASIAMRATAKEDWADPYGIKGLTLKPGTTMSASGGVTGPQVSFTGLTVMGSKEVTLGGTLNSVGAAFRAGINILGLSDVAAVAAEIAKADGQKLDTDGLPVAEFHNVDIAFAGPGVSVPELQITGGGTRLKGDFYFLNPTKRLGELDVNLDVTGMAAKADLDEIALGPLALKNNVLDMAVKATEKPRFAIESESEILGVVTKLRVDARDTVIDVASLQQFGDVFAYSFGATTGGDIDWGAHDFSKTDLRLRASLKSDPGKWIKDEGRKAVEKAFDSLKPGLNGAIKDLEKAQKEVDHLDSQIKSQRDIVKNERQPSIDRLKKAEAEVAKLQKTIDGFDRDIHHFKSEIKSCNQNKRICVWGKPVRNGCGKRLLGACIWYKYKWKCQEHKSIADLPARAICEANNTKPRAELVVAEGKKAGVVTAKATAQKTVEALRKGLESLPVDLDPRVAGLIAAKEVALGTLEAAKQTVKGIGNFTDLLKFGVSAVAKADLFALEESAIQGSLNKGLQGHPVVLDMKFKLAGKSYKNRLAFSLTDWKFNAKQFEVIALGAAVKAVIKKAEEAQITPHELLDRVNKLYLERQARADKSAEQAVEANGNIETDPKDAELSVGQSIDEDTRARRVKHEAERKRLIEVREKLRDIADKKQREQLEKLLAEGGTDWVKLPGKAVDIGAGANGSVWVAGTDSRPYSWTGKDWYRVKGGIVRLDMGPKGDTWAVAKDGTIWSWNGHSWNQTPGRARDIGVGANGRVWVIGWSKEGGGYGIYRLDGSKWKKIDGSALRVDVDPDGQAWVVNNKNDIYRFDGKKWVHMPGKATDIAISASGVVMVIGMDRAPWVWDGKTWHKLPGKNLSNLTLDKDGLPLATDTNNEIWAFGAASQAPEAKFENMSVKQVSELIRKQQKLRQKMMKDVMTRAKKLDLSHMLGR